MDGRVTLPPNPGTSSYWMIRWLYAQATDDDLLVPFVVLKLYGEDAITEEALALPVPVEVSSTKVRVPYPSAWYRSA